MYSYKYDAETGGILLLDSPALISKEPRPVYSQEMDILGFDKFWKYEKQNEVPYMWAEANTYWYRGRKIASITASALYIAPEIKPETNEDGNLCIYGCATQAWSVATILDFLYDFNT